MIAVGWMSHGGRAAGRVVEEEVVVERFVVEGRVDIVFVFTEWF